MHFTNDRTAVNTNPVTSHPHSSNERGFEDNIPKKLFMYWHQGWNEAPEIVKRCAATWQQYNPAWDINLLDSATVGEKVILPPVVTTLNLPLPALSDVTRICLLKEHGGVWADATLRCVRPLDDWIDNVCVRAGFFAYDKLGVDRPISSWFLAAGKECRIVDIWYSAVLHLSAKTQAHARFRWVFDNKEKNWLLNALNRLCMGYLLRRYNYGHLLVTSSDDSQDGNYFWFHYLFGKLLEQNSEFRQLWASTPKISADGPHLLQREELLQPATDRTNLLIREKVSNVHKLTHRAALPDDITGTVLDSLYQSGECN